jgi:hypothetical protein
MHTLLHKRQLIVPGHFDFIGFLGILLVFAEIVGAMAVVSWLYYRVRDWKDSRTKADE